MGAKLLSPGHVSSWLTSYDEEDTLEELIQIYKDSNPDAVQIFGEEKKETLEMFIQSLQDDEADILRIIEEEKKHLLFDKNTITNIPSKITEAIENIDIESYKIWDDDNEPPAAPDAQPLDVIDMENDFGKRHKDGLIPTYCTYCTRYKRIKTANDVKRGDSIRLPRLKGIYYHHAIVKEVLKDNENPTCCSLTLIHLQKSDDSLKPAKTKVKEETIDYNFKQTVLEKVAYKNNPFTPDEIVHRAEEYMLKNKTEKIYNMFWNNCEHIESQLAQGVSESTQVMKKFDQFKSGLSWIFSVLCKIGSKILHLPGVSAIGIMQLLIDNIGKLKKLRISLAEKIICSGCFHREHKALKIAISLSVIGLVLSAISHLNWVTLSISLIVGLAFPICAPLVIKYVMPLIQPAFLIPKHKMSAQNIPKAGDVVTFDYCSLPHEGVVTEVCSYTTDAKIAKATIIHFPWPGLFQKYTVTEEEVYLKLSEALFVVDHSFEETYQPAEVVRRAKNEVGNKNHSSLTYRSSHLARYCKTGEKTLKELPTRLVKTIEDVSPGDIIEFKYCGFSHEAVVTHIGYAQNLEMKIVHYKYNSEIRSLEIVEEKITFGLSNQNNYIHEYESANTYEAEEVVRRARSRIGEKKFNVFKNRSSHLAKWCKLK